MANTSGFPLHLNTNVRKIIIVFIKVDHYVSHGAFCQVYLNLIDTHQFHRPELLSNLVASVIVQSGAAKMSDFHNTLTEAN